MYLPTKMYAIPPIIKQIKKSCRHALPGLGSGCLAVQFSQAFRSTPCHFQLRGMTTAIAVVELETSPEGINADAEMTKSIVANGQATVQVDNPTPWMSTSLLASAFLVIRNTLDVS